LNPGLAYTLSMLGLTRTTASVATLLWAAEPVLIVALARLLLREPVTRRLITLTLAAACGGTLSEWFAGDRSRRSGRFRQWIDSRRSPMLRPLYRVVPQDGNGNPTHC
jgi:drug/metabolite transporter (DMT)-like permease